MTGGRKTAADWSRGSGNGGAKVVTDGSGALYQ